MKSGIVLLSTFLLVVLISGCDDGKDDYSGFSELVAQRNEARKSISGQNAKKSKSDPKTLDHGAKEAGSTAKSKQKESVSSIVLYERKIDIIDTSSNVQLAKGIAYLNKEGQIVRIKVIKE